MVTRTVVYRCLQQSAQLCRIDVTRTPRHLNHRHLQNRSLHAHRAVAGAASSGGEERCGAAAAPGEARRVYVSTSRDVYSNLALEDWLYAAGAQHHGTLLLWTNGPCVVVGRHQNAWAECDVERARRAGVSVARRRSGGGAVYHDGGNLNCTFFTSKRDYNRKRNLEIIVTALNKTWPLLDVAITERDDITLAKLYKVSSCHSSNNSRFNTGLNVAPCTIPF